MVTTFKDREQKQLLKKFHTLLGKSGGNGKKEAILFSYGVESSKDLSANDLLDICNKLAIEADPKLAELDLSRKRVIKVIFLYNGLKGKKVETGYVKSIACRAAGQKSFNEIPLARLNNIYNEWNDKVKVLERVNSIEMENLLHNINLN